MKRFSVLPLLLSLLLLITGCGGKGKKVPSELLFISNEKYFKAFPDSRKRQKVVKKKLGSRLKVRKIEVKSFENIDKDVENFLKEKSSKEAKHVLFVEPFLFPIIANSSALSGYNLWLITYGIGSEPSSSLLGVFHICVPSEHIFNEVKSLVQSDFKQTKKKSVVLFEEYSGISKGFNHWWENNAKEQDMAKLIPYRQNNARDLEAAIAEIPGRTLFLFAGVNNRVINTLNQEKLKNERIVELFTRYGMNNKLVSQYVGVKYDKMLSDGLESKELKEFISSSGKTIVNFEVKSDVLAKKKSSKVKIVRRR